MIRFRGTREAPGFRVPPPPRLPESERRFWRSACITRRRGGVHGRGQRHNKTGTKRVVLEYRHLEAGFVPYGVLPTGCAPGACLLIVYPFTLV